MKEIHDLDGHLIATIHDTEAFAKYLDSFEQNLRVYCALVPPTLVDDSEPQIFGLNQHALDKLNDAAGKLQALRKDLGDEREGLYT